ncbi:Proteasome prosome macropain subunit beta [Fasciola gigantica]|uniref:Proteasome prosome macropain subunit beta n=1 Tax=Fasciola gigantica TaxID=46835 RepID=A0A504YLX5_FASGI|nr:Proteasome prosome macropain subunit beta [Fasciola gigantica]
MGIAGDDFALIASDTRLCAESSYFIYSRNAPHLYQMGPNKVLAATGFHGDVLTLTKLLENRVKTFRYDHGKDISTKALAGLLSVTLYNRRFFPFYVSNILAGLDEEGKGAIYGYDPVGSYERVKYVASGSSGVILQPFLDSRVGGKNMKTKLPPLSRDAAVKLAHDIFISAAERDINCGDGVVICVITQDGVSEHRFPLRRD